MKISVQCGDFDTAAEVEALSAGRTDIGALVTFTGLCRGHDDGKPITAMTLECYETMALAELTRLGTEASTRWPLEGLTIIHRHGRMVPGDRIVLVIAAAAHRAAAFAAADFIMDFLKTRAPFWKAEDKAGGTQWVMAKDIDDRAAERWLHIK